MMGSAPRLMAVVEVDKNEKVFCSQPGCHHTVYKAIHVVCDGTQLLVLGSTCFKKRYGSLSALGKAVHWGGGGKVLTSEERALLAANTEALLARFEAEEERLRQHVLLKRQGLLDVAARLPGAVWSTAPQLSKRPVAVGLQSRVPFPWPWMKPGTSVAAFKLHDGSCWVRVQHKDARHFVVPWPSFDGWDEALPPVVGRPHMDVGGYEVVGALADAVAFLRAHALRERVTGLWGEALTVLGPDSLAS